MQGWYSFVYATRKVKAVRATTQMAKLATSAYQNELQKQAALIGLMSHDLSSRLVNNSGKYHSTAGAFNTTDSSRTNEFLSFGGS